MAQARRVGAIVAGLAVAAAACTSGAELASDRARVLERTCRVMIERREREATAQMALPDAREFAEFLDGDAPRPHSARALRTLCRVDDPDVDGA